MAILKCKMCGGDLTLTDGASVAECEYCGTTQTVPTLDNEKKLNLFARANRLRAACEFDKAAGVYESIVSEFDEEAEAYWGLILCKYGIEYVDDPATGKKIPTCHRSSFECVLDDHNFELVMENADGMARRVYREEAKTIEELRKGIVEVSSKEEPYDIFICYKETAFDGQRTLDSVLAQDIYDALTEKGYRVFFSRVTLEDKLGQEYEPYIFAALQSAKVMLAVGTDYEHYNAVWVKNEWSRFLQLMASGQKKHLIPCFKGIDAYDMPKEFARLQAQDLGKIGAMQDLLRGIEKLLPRQDKAEKEAVVVQQIASSASNPTTDSYLKRAFMFLEEGNWKSADDYCEKVLDIDPECTEAYIGKLCIELKIKRENEISSQMMLIDENKYYKNALRFATGDRKLKVIQYANDTKENIYQRSIQKLSEVKKKEEYHRLQSVFKRLGDYRESASYVEKCAAAITEIEEKGKKKRVIAKALAKYIAAGSNHSLGLKINGTVLSAGSNQKQQRSVTDWKGITAVSAGGSHSLGLVADGTVVATGESGNKKCDVSNWSDVVAVCAGYECSAGLLNNGRVVIATGEDMAKSYIADPVRSWRNIKEISLGTLHIVGLKEDGTVVCVGRNSDGRCNVGDTAVWSNITSIAAGVNHTVGLRADGTVVACGNNEFGRCEVSGWKDIIAVAAGGYHTVGLKADGTVLAIGKNDGGQCSTEDWNNIVAISATANHTIGLRDDGTVVATGWNSEGRCNLTGWKLFDDIDTILEQIENQRVAYFEEQEQIRKAALERKERMRLAEEKRRSDEKKKRLEDLKTEKETLAVELSNLKGFFSGRRRKEIETRLARIESELVWLNDGKHNG